MEFQPIRRFGEWAQEPAGPVWTAVGLTVATGLSFGAWFVLVAVVWMVHFAILFGAESAPAWPVVSCVLPFVVSGVVAALVSRSMLIPTLVGSVLGAIAFSWSIDAGVIIPAVVGAATAVGFGIGALLNRPKRQTA